MDMTFANMINSKTDSYYTTGNMILDGVLNGALLVPGKLLS